MSSSIHPVYPRQHKRTFGSPPVLPIHEGEVVLDMAESARTSAAMLEFNKQVNASIVDPAFIASVRKKLALDQREAAEIFGDGINAVGRSQGGIVLRPPATGTRGYGILTPCAR